MIFSVFDPYSRSYTYYEVAGTSVNFGARGTKHRALTQAPQGPPSGLAGGSSIGAIGFAPEALAIHLPAGAEKIGQGQTARGLIAIRRPSTSHAMSGLGEDTVISSPVPVVVQESVAAYPWKQTLAVACTAAVFGTLFQRWMRKR